MKTIEGKEPGLLGVKARGFFTNHAAPPAHTLSPVVTHTEANIYACVVCTEPMSCDVLAQFIHMYTLLITYTTGQQLFCALTCR